MTPSGSAGDRRALDVLLGGPDTAWLVASVRRRLSTAPGELLSGDAVLRSPSEAQRSAAIELVGRRPSRGDVLRVDLAALEQILRRGPWPAGLADAVLTLGGPIVDRAAERALEAAAWDRAVEGLHDAEGRFPAFGVWWREWCAAGGLKRSVGTEAVRLGDPGGPELAHRLVGDLAAVLAALPATGVPISVFASAVVGDAHGLDASRPLGRLAAIAVGVALGGGGAGLSRRDAWASAGVVLSTVASTVLVLGVAGAPGIDGLASPAARATSVALEAMRGARMPMVLTLDQVRSGGVLRPPPGAVVHVCENPTVVEVAAERWSSLDGADDGAPVLVCTSGQPSTAVVELLELMVSGGAECRYHGDLDWAGVTIARGLHARVPWTPWRLTAADYRSALARDRSSVRLVGRATATPWDPELERAMSTVGIAVEEEVIADLLASDVIGPDTA